MSRLSFGWLSRVLIALVAGGFSATSAWAQSPTFNVGDTVECDATQIGNFRKGKVLKIQPRPGWPDPFYAVQLDDSRDPALCLPRFMRPASAATNQNAPAAKTAPAAPAAATTPAATKQPGAGLCRPGAKVEVARGISWYAATVTGPMDGGGKCPVSLDGYASPLYDMAVTEQWMRPPGSGPIVKPAPSKEGTTPPRTADAAPRTKAPPAGSAPPDGTYSCHKMSPSAPMIQVGSVVVRGGKPTFREGLPDGWTMKGIRYQGPNERGQPLIVVEYRSKAGFDDKLDCVPG